MKTRTVQRFTSLLAILFVFLGIGALLFWNNDITAQSSPASPTCWNLIENGSFEDNSGWLTPITEYSACL